MVATWKYDSALFFLTVTMIKTLWYLHNNFHIMKNYNLHLWFSHLHTAKFGKLISIMNILHIIPIINSISVTYLPQ
jgi:hypothetical protein